MRNNIKNYCKISAFLFAYLGFFSYLCRVKEITINPIYSHLKHTTIMKKNNSIWEILLRIVIAAATAALTALGTTSCMGYGPFDSLA